MPTSLLKTSKNSRAFSQFTKEEFLAALSYVPGRFYEIEAKESWEYVYEIPILKIRGLAIRVYSSVDKATSCSREKGADSIRLTLLRTDNGMLLSEPEKIMRIKGWSTRIVSRCKTLIDQAIKMTCPNCKIILVHRTGKHGVFLGCPNYPKCTHTHSINEAVKYNNSIKK